MEIIHINAEQFETAVLKSEKPVLVDFYADWCGPCSMMSPVIEEIAKDRDDISVAKLDVDTATELALGYGINTIPAFLLFENGEVKAKAIGYMPASALLERLGL